MKLENKIATTPFYRSGNTQTFSLFFVIFVLLWYAKTIIHLSVGKY
jgi:hypothetical protein